MKNTLILLSVILIAWGCKTQKMTSSTPIVQRIWDLQTLGKDSVYGTGVFLVFKDSSHITGFDGCRIFNAKSRWEKKAVSFYEMDFQGNRKCDTTKNISGKIQPLFKQPYTISFKGNNFCLCQNGKTMMVFSERIAKEEPAEEDTTSTPE